MYLFQLAQETHVLVDQEYRNILPLAGEPIKSLFNGTCLGLCIHDKEVLLRLWAGCDVLLVCQYGSGSL